MSTPVARPLGDRTIVVTRPEAQAARLIEAIRAAGGRPVAFPVLAILDMPDQGAINAIIDRLDQFDIAIFISPTAVAKALNLIGARRSMPTALMIAAIGKGSARELARRGLTDVVVPKGRFDSEGLLACEELVQVGGRRIVIFRGEGGRELLGDTLVERGAVVEYAECYLRARPPGDAQALLTLWARDELDALVVTSSEGLRNLYELVGRLGRQWLRRTPVFVPHERIAATARELALERVIVSAGTDEGLLESLTEHFASHRRAHSTPGEDPVE